MATDIEILTNIRNDIRQYLGTASNAEVLNTLKSINATLQSLQSALAKLQTAPVPAPPAPTPTPVQTTSSQITSPITVTTPFVYQTKTVTTAETVNTLQTNNIFSETNASGVLYNIWILIDNTNEFKLLLTIDGADFSITPDQLITFTTGEQNTNNDWQFTYINTPPGPPFALLFKSVDGLQFRNNISFSVQNTSSSTNLVVSQYRFVYKLYV